MRRALRIGLATLFLLPAAACTCGRQQDELEIIDPQGTEFQQALAATRARLAPAETAVRAAAPGVRVVGVQEELGCVRGNKGPKGQQDPWDSECGVRRSLGIFAPDPVGLLLAADKSLTSAGYHGKWYLADGKTEVRVSRSSAVASAVYVTAGGDLVRLQVGRTGQKQLFLADRPRPGYFNDSTGENWEQVVPYGATLTSPVVAVELRVDPFIKRPITA